MFMETVFLCRLQFFVTVSRTCNVRWGYNLFISFKIWCTIPLYEIPFHLMHHQQCDCFLWPLFALICQFFIHNNVKVNSNLFYLYIISTFRDVVWHLQALTLIWNRGKFAEEIKSSQHLWTLMKLTVTLLIYLLTEKFMFFCSSHFICTCWFESNTCVTVKESIGFSGQV